MIRSLPPRASPDLGEAVLVLDLLGALVHDQDFLDVFQGVRVFGQDPGVVQAEVRLVHGGDFEGHLARGAAGLRGVPLAALEHQVRRAPAARSNQYQPPSPNGFSDRSNTEVGVAVDVDAVHALDGAAGVGLVDGDRAGAAGA